MTSAPLRLMLVDDDPVFRLGLKIWLEHTGEFQVVLEADNGLEALNSLADQLPGPAPPWSEADDDTVTSGPEDLPVAGVDLVILDLGLGQGNQDRIPGLQLCADIKSRYPALPVLVLSAGEEPVLQAAARQMGADGYGLRGMPVQNLARLIQQLATGSPLPTPMASVPAEEELSSFGPIAGLRLGLRQTALRQIETTLRQIRQQRQLGSGSVFLDAVLAGRDRELRAARWLVQRLLPSVNSEGGRRSPTPSPETGAGQDRPSASGSDRLPDRKLPSPNSLVPTTGDRLSLQRRDVQGLVFEDVFRKLQGPLENVSDLALETDILRDDRKRELFYLVLRQIEDTLEDLRQAQVLPGQLPERMPAILRDIWQAVITDFFGRYYTLEVDQLERPVVNTLLQDEATVQSTLLTPLPEVSALFGHLLCQESLMVDGGAYLATTPEALNRSRELLENLVLQLGNSVIQPLLNYFADVESIKKYLYQRRIMSTRDIERFRNELSWRYRWDRLINEPKAIFESQYRLLVLTARGIQTRYIYAPRRSELEQLSRVQLGVTLAIEARDAVAPRLRNAIAFVGSGIVYVLTDVIGRGIGLIGRGVFKGIGSAWKDSR